MHPEDLAIVARQLGKIPAGALKIAARERDGWPTVIQVDPLVNGNPFPTLFWLTCPDLKKRVSHLERDGLMAHWESEQAMAEQIQADHHRYRKMRISLLKKRHHHWKQLPLNKLKVLCNTGIGGVRNFSSIKCLHSHYAHFLADSNCLGERVHALLGRV